MTELVRVRLADVPAGGAVRLDGGAHGVCVVRIGEDLFALDDQCSHAKVSLAEGDVDVADRTIECWKHGSAFSLLTGEPQSLPATRPVPVYRVTIEGDHAVVHTDEGSAVGEHTAVGEQPRLGNPS